MGMGSPKVRIQEYDLATRVPQYRGVVGAGVIDARKGPVNKPVYISSSTECINTFGTPNPKKYGLGVYSCLNFLETGPMWMTRVDKGQLFSSALVRSKIYPIVELDGYGYYMAKPQVDPIVYPLGPLSQHQIDIYEFQQYPRTRKVSSFLPEVHLADRPYAGDATITVDDTFPIVEGKKITFKDTTGMTREESMRFATYTVIAKERVIERTEMLVLDTEVLPYSFDSKLKAVVKSSVPYSLPVHVAELASTGQTVVRVDVTDLVQSGQVIKFTGHDTLFTVANASRELVLRTYPDPIYVTGTKGDDFVTTATGIVSQINVGDTVNLAGQETHVVSVSGNTITLTDSLVDDVSLVELDRYMSVTKIVLSSPLDVSLGKGQTITRQVVNVSPYSADVFAKEIIAGYPNKLRVSNHDPVAEGDVILLNGTEYTIVAKESLDNYVNKLTLDMEYMPQTEDLPGAQVFSVELDDYEHHDAFLVYASSPGEWGDDIATAVRDSKNYEEAFNLDVYYQGQLVETWEVTRTEMLDGYGQQLYLESKINTSSRYIRVKNNPFMLDEDGNPVEPLKTLYYIKQPVATPIYTKVAEMQETVWDGDNLLRVKPDSIYELNILRQINLNGRLYGISQLESSTQDGVMDTIVLEQAVSLGLEALPTNQRYLPIGTSVTQSIVRFQKAKVYASSVADNTVYSLTISGTTYTVNSGTGATAKSVLAALAAEIHADPNNRVSANMQLSFTVDWIEVRANVAGIPFTITSTSSLVIEELEANARDFKTYPIQKVSGSIMPTSRIGSVSKLVDGSYTIWDAGANLSSGGWDGDYPTVGQYLTALEGGYTDPEIIDYLVMLDTGVTHFAYQQAIVKIAERRMDCFGLLSVSYAAQANPDINMGVIKYRQDLLLNSSYGSLTSPWVKIYDKFTDQSLMISPESYVGRAISFISAERELWYAPAGWNYGRIIANGAGAVYNEAQRDLLYDNQINPIRVDPKKGMAIYGQKTLQVKPSPLDRVNVRFLLIVLERALKEFLEFQVFEINTPETQRRMYLEVNGYMSDIKTRNGVYDYLVVCDASNNGNEVIDNNEMYIDVRVKPVMVAEFLTGRVTVTRTGASFTQSFS